MYFHVLPFSNASQALWYSKNIKIDNKGIYLSEISEKALIVLGIWLMKAKS